MTTSSVRRFVASLVVAVLVVLLAGCGQSFLPEVGDMARVRAQPGLTEAKAQAKIAEYLTLTLSRLPQQVSLSRKHPTAPHGDLPSGNSVPCVDDDTVKDPPWNYDVTYWVIGVPPGEAEHYQDLVVEAWRGLGWRTGRLADMRIMAKTPDGYSLHASINQYGDLSMLGGSPCFAGATIERKEMPVDIPHPPAGGS